MSAPGRIFRAMLTTTSTRPVLLHPLLLARPIAARGAPVLAAVVTAAWTRGYAKKASPAGAKGGKGGKAAESASSMDPWEWSSDKLESNMTAIVSRLSDDLVRIDVAKASPTLLDLVRVKLHKEIVPLSDVAQVTIKDAHSLRVVVPEEENFKAVENAIRSASLNLNPMPESKTTLKVPIPRASKDLRETLAKQVHKVAETYKGKVRDARHEEIAKVKNDKHPNISSDDRKAVSADVRFSVLLNWMSNHSPSNANSDRDTQIEKITKTFTDKIDAVVKAKNKALLG
ncbi:ribosome recycling factor domain-containing protein [Blastocladiella britannica]|nr:ribosome recycling factor domain-containing protein [Blastocladiella britannica]